jgi:hypothetical protein
MNMGDLTSNSGVMSSKLLVTIRIGMEVVEKSGA